MCEQCLSLCDFINEPSLEAIQAIICLNIYYNNNDRACAARSLLGVAIRMALTLGLSVRLNHDNPNPDNPAHVSDCPPMRVSVEMLRSSER